MQKQLLTALPCLIAYTVQGGIFEFDLGPNPGLNGANLGTTSTATGGEIQGFNTATFGIQYNDVSKALEIHIGWGTEFGGNNLAADFLAASIGTPTAKYDLVAEAETAHNLNPNENFYRGALENGRTGAFDLTMPLRDGVGGLTVADQQAQLLAGDWKITISSVGLYSNAEIGGELAFVPEPQHAAAFAAAGLLALVSYRRYRLTVN